ncbi:MAG TPA: hypothetical protein VL992_00830, partial [Tepidisphaeraceae bacterium]|nr:hypothetical protein [Tepidisphaeraceae bacterium]
MANGKRATSSGFFKSFFSGWRAAVGVPAMILAIIAVICHWTIPGIVAGITSFVGFFVASYLVWFEEHKKLLALTALDKTKS